MKETEANFHAMRRLVASRAGFAAFTNLPGFREKLGLKVCSHNNRMVTIVTIVTIW